MEGLADDPHPSGWRIEYVTRAGARNREGRRAASERSQRGSAKRPGAGVRCCGEAGGGGESARGVFEPGATSSRLTQTRALGLLAGVRARTPRSRGRRGSPGPHERGGAANPARSSCAAPRAASSRDPLHLVR